MRTVWVGMSEAITSKGAFILNLAVADLDRSVAFFAKLGWKQLSDCDDFAGSACMQVSEHVQLMLLSKARFGEFAAKPVGDATAATQAILTVQLGSREQVNRGVALALANGARPAADTVEMGPCYTRSFFDPDGHHWELMHMGEVAR